MKEVDPDQEMMRDMIFNMISSRSKFLQQFLDPRRDLYAECGYPQTETIQIEAYRELYDREGVARRVVEVFPVACWQKPPVVYEVEKASTKTEFEEGFENLHQSLLRSSRYKPKGQKEHHLLWHYLRQLDIKSGIGTFGLMLIGIDDGMRLSEPVEGLNELTGEIIPTKTDRKLLYLRVFDQSQITVTKSELNKEHPRYGEPLEYTILMSDRKMEQFTGSEYFTGETELVHWSRVIHSCDEETTYAAPRMRAVLNYILNIQKLYGGSAEMYWRGAFPGLSFETHPQLGGDVEVDASAIRDQMEQWSNGLQRGLISMGMTAKSLAPQVVDPTAQVEVQLDAICICKAVPKRIFVGSERGELASSQDAIQWDWRVYGRNIDHCASKLVIPTIDRCISLGILPAPSEENGFCVEYDKPEGQSPMEKATIASTKTEALAKYVGGRVESLIQPLDYLTRVHDYSEDEAMEMLDASMEANPDDSLTIPPEPEGLGLDEFGQPVAAPAPNGVPPKGSPIPTKGGSFPAGKKAAKKAPVPAGKKAAFPKKKAN